MSWDMVRLGDVCSEDKTVTDGKSSSKPYLGLEMIESETGAIDWSNSANEGISICYIFDSRHILYGKLRPYLNKVALPKIEGRCSTEIIPLLPNPDICREYIAFLLRRKETIDYVMPENTGSRMPRADMKHLLDMEIPLPPINEQRRIAAEIERQLAIVERAKQAATEQLATARTLNAAYLREVFAGNDWGQARLDEVCEDIFAGGDVPYGQFSKTKTAEYRIPIYTNGEANDGFFGYTNYARVTKKSVTISGRGTIGYSSVREAGYFPAIRLIAVIPKNILDADFLYYSLLSHDFRKDGTSIPQLTVPMVKGIKITLPKINEQQKITSYLKERLQKAEKTTTAIQYQLDTINAMPATILRQAFSGQM